MAPALAGVVSALAILGIFRLTNISGQRGALLVLLGSIVVFYPVFAIENGDTSEILLHFLIAAAFFAAGIWSALNNPKFLAPLVGIHGLFDILTAVYGSPAPLWWPVFCGALDIAVAAACMLCPVYLISNADLEADIT